MIVRYILEFKLKKLLLIVLLFTDTNGAYGHGRDDSAFLAHEAIEKEIAEFEAKLAKELADKAAQEMMAEIEAEFEAKAKLPKLQPTVCEPNRGGYEAYMLGIKN